MSDPLDDLDPDVRAQLEDGRAEWDAAYDQYLERWGEEILMQAQSQLLEDRALK